MNHLKQPIHTLSREIFPAIVEYRRYFHANPELAMQEYNTAAFITNRLHEWGIPYRDKVAKTGIIATIEGVNPGSDLIALRADMDALPIVETNHVPYRSVVEGVMHACGHDAHMASLLGTAFILNQLKNEFEGSIRLIFQPSEEALPGGASLMIAEGALENPRPRCIFGQHVLPQLDTGWVGFGAGPAMASSDEIYIRVLGKGGHGATPELLVDPVLMGAHLVTALQQIVSRNTPPHTPCVLSFGRFIADGKTNIIPNEVKLEGILRTYDSTWRAKSHEIIRNMAVSLCSGMGGEAEVNIVRGYPVLINDPELTHRLEKAAMHFLGNDHVTEIEPRMTAEDFAYYSQVIPACFYRLGIRNIPRGIDANLHTSHFDMDENALLTGSALMAWLAVNELQSGQNKG